MSKDFESELDSDIKVMKNAINLGEFKHSWHLGGHGKNGGPTEYPEEVIEIIDLKINKLEKELIQLNQAREIATKYKERNEE